jgi:hypothetical protein
MFSLLLGLCTARMWAQSPSFRRYMLPPYSELCKMWRRFCPNKPTGGRAIALAGSIPGRSCGICGGQSGIRRCLLQVALFQLPILIPSSAPHSSIIRSHAVSILTASLNNQLKTSRGKDGIVNGKILSKQSCLEPPSSLANHR